LTFTVDLFAKKITATPHINSFLLPAKKREKSYKNIFLRKSYRKRGEKFLLFNVKEKFSTFAKKKSEKKVKISL
jgi:hypothetical protein